MWFIPLKLPWILPELFFFVVSLPRWPSPWVCPFAQSSRWVLHSKLVSCHKIHSWREVNFGLYASTQGNCDPSQTVLGEESFSGHQSMWPCSGRYFWWWRLGYFILQGVLLCDTLCLGKSWTTYWLLVFETRPFVPLIIDFSSFSNSKLRSPLLASLQRATFYLMFGLLRINPDESCGAS